MFRLLFLFLYFTRVHGLIMPMTKLDGSLDVSSLLSHISLLEQMIESKASVTETTDLKSQLHTTQAQLQATQAQLQVALSDLKTTQVQLKTTQDDLKIAQTEIAQFKTTAAELKEVKSDLKATQIEVAVLQSQLKSATTQCSCNTTTAQSSTDITSLKTDVSTLKTDVFHLQSQRNTTQQTFSGGATFTRWGKKACPNDTRVIYKGYTGGTYFSNKASSATILCLPEHPIYAAHTSSSGTYYSHIYGTEYETDNNGDSFHNMFDEDMPCVVCESQTKRSAIMVPARNQCYPGWDVEYWGYLMGARDNYASAEYICVDKDPEASPGGHENKNGQVLYIVKSECGSLPCPPYMDNWEITCAVCSN